MKLLGRFVYKQCIMYQTTERRGFVRTSLKGKCISENHTNLPSLLNRTVLQPQILSIQERGGIERPLTSFSLEAAI